MTRNIQHEIPGTRDALALRLKWAAGIRSERFSCCRAVYMERSHGQKAHAERFVYHRFLPRVPISFTRRTIGRENSEALVIYAKQSEDEGW
jgi:hypothetical protein